MFAGTPRARWCIPITRCCARRAAFCVSYSLPPVAIALGRRALDIACAVAGGRVSRGVTRLAESEVVQMTVGEAAAAIDAATLLLHTGRDDSTAAVSSGRTDHRGRGVARAPRHGLRAAPGRLGDRAAVRNGGARWVYDSDPLRAIRRDVMTILTHHAASRQAAYAPYGRRCCANADKNNCSPHSRRKPGPTDPTQERLKNGSRPSPDGRYFVIPRPGGGGTVRAPAHSNEMPAPGRSEAPRRA